MIGETVWDNIPTDFLESVLSTRRFINSPSIVPLISHSLIQTLSSNNFHVSSLINHLLNGYYIFQIDRSITRARCSSILIISPYIIWSTFLKFLKFFAFVSRFPFNRGESFVRPHATATPREYFYSHAEARAKKKDRAASSRVSLFNACPRKTGSRHWKGYGQVYSPPSKGFKSRGYLNDPRIYALSHVVSNRTEKVVGNCCSRRTRILNNSQSSRSFVSLDRSIIQVDKCIFIISGFWYSGFNLLWFKKKRTGNPWIFEGNYSSNRFSECIINARKRAWNVRNGRIGVEETSTGAEWKRRYFQRRLLVVGFSSISGGGRRPSREAAASSRPLMFLYLATSHLFTGLCPVDKLLAAIISRLNRDAGQLLLPFPRNFPSSFEDPSASSIENH